ncbi:MAG TPA: SDR family oxidoreductase [Bryobacteraceae bacterium]|nr:SDR family oxidoreductase [Bryobacteraceae bacterium]
MPNPFRLDGKIALITGAASGIGEATARTFAEAGARVLIVDLNAEHARQVASSIAGSEPYSCDVTDETQVARLFASITELDIVVNCAGIGMVGSIEETGLAEFQRLFRVNVEGTFLVTRAAIPLLSKVRGSVVNIGSVAGLVGIKRRFAYCATKGAIVAMTRQLAVDYPIQIRVNCIAPGTVDTPFVEAYLEKYHRHEKEKVRLELNERQPLGRLGTPEEIAHLALYICSPAADFMSGSVVTIDGGWTAA